MIKDGNPFSVDNFRGLTRHVFLFLIIPLVSSLQSFALDTFPPTVKFIRPANHSTIYSGEAEKGLVIETDENHQPARVEFYFDGLKKDLLMQSPRIFTFAGPFAEGPHMAKVVAFDSVGNTSEALLFFTMKFEMTSPQVTIQSPENSSLIKGTVTVTTLMTDPEKNGRPMAALYVDRWTLITAPPLATLNSVDDKGIAWVRQTRTIDTRKWTDGLHAISLISENPYGALSNSDTIQVVISNNNEPDGTPPTIRIVAPTSGSILYHKSSSSTLVEVDAHDNKGLYAVEYFIDDLFKGKVVAPPYGLNLRNGEWPLGNHMMKAKATDYDGNIAEATVEFTVKNDLSKPLFNLISPRTGERVRGLVKLQYSVSDPESGLCDSTIEVDPTGFGTGRYSRSPLPEVLDTRQFPNGSHWIHFDIFNCAGSRYSPPPTQIIVDNAKDTTPPKLQFFSPRSGSTVNLAILQSAIIQAEFKDDKELKTIAYFVDGEPVGEGYFPNFKFRLQPDHFKRTEGPFRLTALATDSEGNTSEETIQLNLKNNGSLPDVTIQSPLDGETVRDSITLNLKIEHPDSPYDYFTCFVDDMRVAGYEPVPNSINEGREPWILDTTKLSDGTHGIYFEVENTSKTLYSKIQTIVVENRVKDALPPQVALQGPVFGKAYRSIPASCTMQVKASDDMGLSSVQIFVDGEKKETIDLGGGWVVNLLDYLLPDGVHRIMARAIDLAGNIDESFLDVTIKKTPETPD